MHNTRHQIPKVIQENGWCMVVMLTWPESVKYASENKEFFLKKNNMILTYKPERTYIIFVYIVDTYIYINNSAFSIFNYILSFSPAHIFNFIVLLSFFFIYKMHTGIGINSEHQQGDN